MGGLTLANVSGSRKRCQRNDKRINSWMCAIKPAAAVFSEQKMTIPQRWRQACRRRWLKDVCRGGEARAEPDIPPGCQTRSPASSERGVIGSLLPPACTSKWRNHSLLPYTRTVPPFHTPLLRHHCWKTEHVRAAFDARSTPVSRGFDSFCVRADGLMSRWI